MKLRCYSRYFRLYKYTPQKGNGEKFDDLIFKDKSPSQHIAPRTTWQYTQVRESFYDGSRVCPWNDFSFPAVYKSARLLWAINTAHPQFLRLWSTRETSFARAMFFFFASRHRAELIESREFVHGERIFCAHLWMECFFFRWKDWFGGKFNFRVSRDIYCGERENGWWEYLLVIEWSNLEFWLRLWTLCWIKRRRCLWEGFFD